MPTAAAGAPGVSGVPPRALPAHDGGEEAGGLAVGGLQRGGGTQGSQVTLRAPQGSGREGWYSLIHHGYSIIWSVLLLPLFTIGTLLLSYLFCKSG